MLILTTKTTIIFIAKIPLQFQIKPELHGDFSHPLDPLPGFDPELAWDLGGQ
jgi:hypothetical protein